MLEFTPADLARVDAQPLSRWLPVSGTVQPLRQATVKGQGVGRRAPGARCGKANPCSAGQLLARIDTADLEAKLIERNGALESAKAQLAMAAKTQATQPGSSSSRTSFRRTRTTIPNRASACRRARSSRRRPRSSSPATRCATRSPLSPLAGVVAKRHVQVGEKVAFDSPLVTVVDLTDMELQAAVPAVDVPELAIGKSVELTIDGFGERRFTGRVERINPAAEPGTRAILVYVGIPNADGALRGGMFATGRIALAASAPVPTLPATAMRTEAGQTFVWTVEGGKLVKRGVMTGRTRRRHRARRGQDRACRRTRPCWPRASTI